MTKKSISDTLRRTCLILAGSFIMAVNLKSFVRAGGLIPGGFNGLTRLIQEISVLLWHWEPPFSVINFILNAVPVVISFKFIGKKFTGYSCLMIVVSGILTGRFRQAYWHSNEVPAQRQFHRSSQVMPHFYPEAS